ncbi:hypothetical protein CCR85_07245 [Rhodothalassium salexigens]|uniref:hypothetical protein n=1 Tax=Rhodothalassium salexigens TaxID=1086 RepID=UPI0019133C89|nr:hypothetical protein [Rhodothalassium salexigens]MBK5911287.1 hypothetical protein [Rhodothalassium salexigens]MBK5921449.1 hypothetical protein [Rhodothalassium salexigens]
MAKGRAKVETVMGHRLAGPKLTPWAPVLVGLYLFGPLLGLLALLDLVLYLVFRFALDRCYGVFCLLAG